LVNKYLDSVGDHKTRPRSSSNLPFHPLVFSFGGMMNGSTTKVFASWKQVMARGTYILILKRPSLCLLQARVRSFAPGRVRGDQVATTKAREVSVIRTMIGTPARMANHRVDAAVKHITV
jgi:hypothetical protein